ncbi:MAG: histone deacetylase [Anaerolinea sp.]|nr:histone deacetylase [Anaerolinea sp.]
MTGFVSSPRFVEHQTGPHHPERPDRIRAIYRGLSDARLLDSPDPFPDFVLQTGIKPAGCPPLRMFEPVAADERWLNLAHSPEHVARVRRICQSGGGVLDQGDTPTGANGHDMAMLSLGAALTAADAVLTGRVRRAFCAGRPPGHHAEPDRAMGFCLYSNVAITARYLQRQHGVDRVAIVDFDVHHGNGTQACLEDDPSILFISLHQHPATCYPGSGHAWEVGNGAARGLRVNIPLPPGCDDETYLQAVRNTVVRRLDSFRPEVLVLSAGFDAHRDDPLAQLELSEEGFGQITAALVELAETHGQGRVVSVLEGGYHLRALARSVVRHVLALA